MGPGCKKRVTDCYAGRYSDRCNSVTKQLFSCSASVAGSGDAADTDVTAIADADADPDADCKDDD